MKRKWIGSVGAAPKPSGDYIYYNSCIFGEVDTETGTLEIAKKGEKLIDAVSCWRG